MGCYYLKYYIRQSGVILLLPFMDFTAKSDVLSEMGSYGR